MKKTLFTLALILFATSSFAGWFSSDTPLPHNYAVMDKICDKINERIAELGEFDTHDEYQFAVVKVFAGTAKDFGYSFDATMREYYEGMKAEDPYWNYSFQMSGIGKLYDGLILLSFTNPEMMIKAGAITRETAELLKGLPK